MDNSVLVAVISGLFTLLGSFGGILTSSKLTNYRLQQLEEKVNKHNQVVERVYELEKHNEVQDKELENIGNYVAELKSYHKPV